MTVRPVRVVPHDPAWPDVFKAELDDLLPVFGNAATAIHHMGSTSGPGLWGKPVLDILVETPSLDLIDSLTPSLEALRYDARGTATSR